MLIDFHVHTLRGSADSDLDPFAMIDRARSTGLDGLCITEHDFLWRDQAIEDYARRHGVALFQGIEVTTEFGHVSAIGLDRYVGGIYKLPELRRVIDDVGGFLIANHPFRYRLDRRHRPRDGSLPVDPDDPQRAAGLEIFSLVDEVEVANGACAADENRFAAALARHLGWKGIGGSDSHSAQSLGCAATALERRVSTVRELVAELRAGRYRACERVNSQPARGKRP